MDIGDSGDSRAWPGGSPAVPKQAPLKNRKRLAFFEAASFYYINYYFNFSR
jgi:hypothetical protein